uniref:General transcription and DNA repair factor IIH subunit TFB5 n=1 Tax=Equus asinus TaxID=9793 RepID=A0A9L0JKW3_EQUAS
MVNVLKGVLIECDPAMKQFLLYLDESNALGKKFIIQDIDDTHVFVIAELVNVLQERLLGDVSAAVLPGTVSPKAVSHSSWGPGGESLSVLRKNKEPQSFQEKSMRQAQI